MSEQINVILAPLAGRTVCTAKRVYQYNQGMILRLLGIDLPQAYTVDFANSVTGSSISQAVDDCEDAVEAAQTVVETAETAVSHYPTVIDGYWHVWDVSAGEYVSTGVSAEGTQGPTGPQGPKGETGATGAQGPQGPAGAWNGDS